MKSMVSGPHLRSYSSSISVLVNLLALETAKNWYSHYHISLDPGFLVSKKIASSGHSLCKLKSPPILES